jgi:hypothetical protein
MRQSVARSQRVTLNVVVLEETRGSVKCRIDGIGTRWLARVAIRGGGSLHVGFSGRVEVSAGHMEGR